MSTKQTIEGVQQSGEKCQAERLDLASILSGGHIPGLDALRGISASLVVFSHLGLVPLEVGNLGVAVFFVLSGFLITWLLLKENAKTGQISLRAFYMRRTLRIFPAFYFFWLVCIGLNLRQVVWKEAWLSFFYLGDYYAALKPVQTAAIMGITWSLGIEEKFYLLWPWAFRALRHNLNKASALLAVVIGSVWIYRILMWDFVHPGPVYLRYAFESRLDNIAYGCLLAVIVYSRRAPSFFARITANTLFPCLTILVILFSVWFQIHFGRGYHYVFGMSFEAALIAVLLVQMVVLSKTRYWKWIEYRPFRFAGKISYSLYLFHPLAIGLTSVLLASCRLRWQISAGLTLSFAFATLSYYLVEKPFLRIKRRFEIG